MASRAEIFFALIVRPTVSEFLATPWDVRRGMLAAIVLDHMADYVALESHKVGARKLRDCQNKFKGSLIAKWPDFSLVKDVADASKHAQLDSKQPRMLTTSEDITGTPGLFQAPFGEGVFLGAARVIVRLIDGTERPLDDCVRSVMVMWEAPEFHLIPGR